MLPGGFLSLGAERWSQCERNQNQIFSGSGEWRVLVWGGNKETRGGGNCFVRQKQALSPLSQGLWLSVASVREETPAGNSGLRSKDLVTRWNILSLFTTWLSTPKTRINGRIVFHLDPADVARLIRQSGNRCRVPLILTKIENTAQFFLLL